MTCSTFGGKARALQWLELTTLAFPGGGADLNSTGQRYESQATLYPPSRAESCHSVASGRNVCLLPQLSGEHEVMEPRSPKILSISSRLSPRIR